MLNWRHYGNMYTQKKKQNPLEMRNEPKEVFLTVEHWIGFKESVNSFEI